MQPFSIFFAAAAVLLGALSDIDPAESFVCKADISDRSYPALVSSIEKRYGAVADVTASFVQYSYFAGLDKGEKSYGSVQFRKPGMMDWSYEGPQEQRFVSDGTTMWFYQPEDNQVTIAGFSNAFQSDLPVSFLLGLGKLGESFEVERACRGAVGTVLELSPRADDAGFQRFRLLVREDDFVPIGAQVLDVGGNETTIRLAGVDLNSGLAAKRFSFEIPRGVDVIDRRREVQAPGAIEEESLVSSGGE